MVFGLIALFLGSVASFAVPGLLGIVVDAMLKNEKDKIRDFCLYMLIICVVSGVSSGMRGTIFNMMSYKITGFGIDKEMRPSCLGALAVVWAARATCGEIADCVMQWGAST